MATHNFNVYSTMINWSKSDEVKNTPQIFKHLKTAFKYWILQEFDSHFNPNSTTPKQLETYLRKFLVINLNPDALLEIFDRRFDQAVANGLVSSTTKGNYRSALGRYVQWIKEQLWYEELFPSSLPVYAPPLVSASQKKPPLRSKAEKEYAFKDANMPLALQQNMDFWRSFWQGKVVLFTQNKVDAGNEKTTASQRRQQREQRRQELTAKGTEYSRPQVNIIANSTYKRYKKIVNCFFGWLVHFEEYHPDELNLLMLTDIVLIEEFCVWLLTERKCTTSSSVKVIQAVISIAKCFTYEQSSTRDWSDIPLVQQLKNLQSHYLEQYKQQKPQLDQKRWENKEITHEQAQLVVQYLRSCCAERSNSGTLRTGNKIVWNWQVYLMVKILVYAPIRQEELRKLIFGKTLIKVKDNNGTFRYAVKLKEHKTFNQTHKVRFYPLPSILTADLDMWLQVIRPKALLATKDLSTWLAFTNKKLTDVEKLQQQLEDAQQGILPASVKNVDNYITEKKRELRAINSCIEVFEKVKENAAVCENVFFSLGFSTPKSFAQPYTDQRVHNVTSFVSAAVGRATKALFNKECFLNPHGFRNIGSKQVRKVGNDKAAFSALVGHSLEVDDDYAAQITSDYELIIASVDGWWCVKYE
ncbi:hypothetical protein Cri9333_4966 (plasmid) [Crinalium epipsammum PCC 9333]|uniref:Core-binding (CB) domain-containing protein n=1 Tax=Crinalium epipsammum PCC 9333 TaxID=1173022 RepID=K9W6B9_9CYAN|nr:hypothetical protein [Crinalium epipsammum]AFZ15721.1 hypothetical protein Cri9333_4966 [Crinalium epipsammum PCC 9333]